MLRWDLVCIHGLLGTRILVYVLIGVSLIRLRVVRYNALFERQYQLMCRVALMLTYMPRVH